MIDAGRSNGTGAMRWVNHLELMICQKRVPPEVELQPEPLSDAFENPVGVVHAFKPQPGLDDHEAGAQSAAARHTANTSAAEQYSIRRARSSRSLQERCQVAVRIRARTSTTAVEPGLIVLVLQAAYLGGNHREVVCADQNGPTRGAVVPAPPVWNPGVVVLPEPFRRVAEIGHQFVESSPAHAACDRLGKRVPVSSGHNRPVVGVTVLFDESPQVLRFNCPS